MAAKDAGLFQCPSVPRIGGGTAERVPGPCVRSFRRGKCESARNNLVQPVVGRSQPTRRATRHGMPQLMKRSTRSTNCISVVHGALHCSMASCNEAETSKQKRMCVNANQDRSHKAQIE